MSDKLQARQQDIKDAPTSDLHPVLLPISPAARRRPGPVARDQAAQDRGRAPEVGFECLLGETSCHGHVCKKFNLSQKLNVYARASH